MIKMIIVWVMLYTFIHYILAYHVERCFAFFGDASYPTVESVVEITDLFVAVLDCRRMALLLSGVTK